MKFFIVFALCVGAACARFVVPDIAVADAAELKEILAAINNPSTDPATAAALQQLLNDILGIADSPIHVGPAIVEESPIAPGPVIVDENEDSPIHVGPAIIDESDVIDVSPVIVDEQTSSSSPLVQIVQVFQMVQIINVNSGASVPGSPVVVEDPEPTPVIVVDSPENIEDAEKPIINAPVFPSPAVIPDTLN